MNIEHKVCLALFISSYIGAKVIIGIELKTNKWKFPKTKNFKGEMVQTGYGLLFAVFGFICFVIPALDVPFVFLETKFRSVSICSISELIKYGLPLCIFSVGYYDDLRGQKGIKGLSKNIKSFLNTGRFTSSLLKLLVIFVCAFLWAFTYQFWPCSSSRASLKDAVVDVFVIALFTNFLNLVDLRPGRALKISVLCFVLLFIIIGLRHGQKMTASESLIFIYIIPVLASVLAYAPLDFRGQAMMGDAGSNMLGFVLGIGYAVILPLPAKIAVVLLLTVFHIYCEFYSFSDFISRNRVLRFLDEFGTCMRENKK